VIASNLTEAQFQVIREIAPVGYSSRSYVGHASGSRDSAKGTIRNQLYGAHQRLPFDTPSVIITALNDGDLSLDELIKGKEQELEAGYSRLWPAEIQLLRAMVKCALNDGSVSISRLATELSRTKNSIRGGNSRIYSKLRPVVSNRAQLATVAFAYAARYNDEVAKYVPSSMPQM
jgi:hypothetical protein